MSYSSTADTLLEAGNTPIEAVLELKTNFSGSSSFVEYDYKEITLNIRDGVPREMRASLLNTAFAFSNETDQTIRTQLKAIAKLTVTVGSESEVKFYGRMTGLEPADTSFSTTFRCLQNDLLETGCNVFVTPSTEEVVDESTRRALTNVDASQPRVYGFVDDDTGTDAAFRQGGSAPRPRRSWEKRPIRVWKHITETGDEYQLTGTKFEVDWVSGVIMVYEAEDDLLATYYVDNVSAYQESLASGADNCDWARVFQQVLTYQAQAGGPGFVLGTDYGNAVTAVTAVSKQITIAGDFREHYPDGAQIYLQENTGLTAATLTINGTPTFGSGNTVITVNETITGISADGYISPDVGLDLSRPYEFSGKCSDALEQITEEAQANLKYWFEPETMRFRYTTVEQLPKADPMVAGTNYHHELIKPKSIGQSRDTRDFYTRVVATGKTTFPVNDVANAGGAGLVTDITSGTPDWFLWDGANVGADDSFANIIPYMWDGDGNKAAAAHNIESTADVDGVSGDKYKGYYYFCKIDLGSVKNIDRIRVHMPGSRNEKPKAGHQGIFWPGVKLEISDDDATWNTISVEAFGRYEPGSVLDFSQDAMQRSRGRYVRVLCGAYKEGFRNQSDPCIAIAELEIWTNEDYEVVREISPLHPIIAANTGSDYFDIEGDFVKYWTVGDTFTVIESTGNNGNYEVLGVALQGGNTRIAVNTAVKAVADATADGRLYSTTDYAYLNGDTEKRDYPDLWTRNGDKQKELRKDFGRKYSEAIAGDVALTYFAEGIRLFQECDYKSVCDPRPRIWRTAYAVDEMNGNVAFLIQDIVLRFGKNMNAEFNGVDYQSEVPV